MTASRSSQIQTDILELLRERPMTGTEIFDRLPCESEVAAYELLTLTTDRKVVQQGFLYSLPWQQGTVWYSPCCDYPRQWTG